ncbi:hypothetical protein TcBrA4_0006590 [Trypanosoma cruzi]|nr:hypothetical protein TcBrA4_0006590 [Trypanosoma cruzi]
MGACGSKGSTRHKGLARIRTARTPRTARKRGSAFAQAIPREKTAEAKQRRIELFKKFDKNETGKLCYDEVYSGCLEVLKLDEFTSRVARHHEACIRQGEGLAASWRTRAPRTLLNFWSSSDAVLHLRLLRADGDVRRD